MYDGTRVTVMGLGVHGGAIGTIRWLAEQGAQVTVTDLKTDADLRDTVNALKDVKNIRWVLGKHDPADFTNVDMVVRNPAVPRKSSFLEMARAAGVPVEMDSSLFFKHCPSRFIVGVTGSKGKTTTTNALGIVLKALDEQTVVVGVEGTSPLGELKVITTDTPVVFELSSWRLEALDEYHLSPHIAVATSLYRDHLNTYASFEEYIEMKKTIVRYQTADDIAVLNGDDPLLRRWAPDIHGALYWYAMTDLGSEQGIGVRDGLVTIFQDGKTEPLLPLAELPLASVHERRNLLPAIFVAYRHGVPVEKIKAQLHRIRPLPHRLEPVRTLNDVTYINDSTATMPDATIAAIKALGSTSLVILVGGSDKKLLFDDVAQALAQANIRTLIFLPGTATAPMKEKILAQNPGLPFTDAATMQEAVRLAAAAAQPGDTVLLSPGATSFGLFQHEFDRGNQFRAAVLALPST